jgi:hypothetical protein
MRSHDSVEQFVQEEETESNAKWLKLLLKAKEMVENNE